MRMLMLFEAYLKKFAKICCGHNFRSWCNQGSLNNQGSLIFDAMVQNVKHWISQEQNMTFPRNKKCLNWFSKTILVIVYRGGSHWIFFNFQRKVIVTKFICTYLYFRLFHINLNNNFRFEPQITFSLKLLTPCTCICDPGSSNKMLL